MSAWDVMLAVLAVFGGFMLAWAAILLAVFAVVLLATLVIGIVRGPDRALPVIRGFRRWVTMAEHREKIRRVERRIDERRGRVDEDMRGWR